jgi:small subunit ribosomal protein S21
MNGVFANYDDEPVERIIRRFNKVVDKAGVLSEVKNRRNYEKPSERKRREHSLSVFRGTKNRSDAV